MDIIEIIAKKKDKKELNEQEISFLVDGFAFKKSIANYQMGALLMALRLNGMTNQEIYFLTKAFVNTSKKYEFKRESKNPIIDKHSSGGIGDKVSIIIIPILNALGLDIAKISGRSLWFTGGTVDKLDSISFNSDLSETEAKRIFNEHGMVLLQQTEDLVPADKVFYALRDVTSTMETEGLIISSILSKKLVLNSDYIFIDLKVGSGALIKNVKEAKSMASKMIEIAKLFKRKLFIHLTNMNAPLGNSIGNAIEIKEVCDFLLNKNRNVYLNELISNFVIDILLITKKARSIKQASEMYENVIINHLAYQKLLLWFESQGVNNQIIENDTYFNPTYKMEIFAKKDGYIRYKESSNFGIISIKLGAGRTKLNDQLDYQAGIYLNKNYGDKVKKKELIAILYSSKPIDQSLVKEFESLIEYSESKIKNDKMIICSLSSN